MTIFNPRLVRDAFFRYAEQRGNALFTHVLHTDHDSRVRTWNGPGKIRVLQPRRDTLWSKAFWAGFDGKKNQRQFAFGSKEETIYEAGKAYFESLGIMRAHGMRLITVDEVTYRYTIDAPETIKLLQRKDAQ